MKLAYRGRNESSTRGRSFGMNFQRCRCITIGGNACKKKEVTLSRLWNTRELFQNGIAKQTQDVIGLKPFKVVWVMQNLSNATFP